MLGHDQEISYRKLFQVVIQKKEIRVVIGSQPFALGPKGPIKKLVSEDAFWLFSSYSSLHDPQKKSATGLLFGNGFIVGHPQLGQ